jgi:hypothetical protein
MRLLAAFFATLISSSCTRGTADNLPNRAEADSSGETPASKFTILLRPASEKNTKDTFVVTGLSPGQLESLVEIKGAVDRALFAVYVQSDRPTKERPPVLGSCQIEEDTLIFAPRFPLERGIRYRAVFNPSRLPGATKTDEKPIIAEFIIPRPKTTPTTEVDRVYPSASLLPENQLKFYVHFSAPVSRGEAYRHIHLLKSGGEEVELPFLELGEELWDRTSQRFTLFFDPGRIKRGLKPRADFGPALEEGKSYTLIIDRAWPDADGNPLKKAFRKSFRVGPPDDQPPDPKTWKIPSPSADTTNPLMVSFPKPLDHALLQRMIWVIDDAGRRLDGKMEVSHEETHWQFTPQHPWRAGAYHLVVDTALEDLAGNSIGRPFEVDVFQPIQREVKKELIKLPFQVTKAKDGK